MEAIMKKQLFCFIAILLTALLWIAPAFSVEVGDKAPDFVAESTMGTIRLADYLGKKNVLLAFYYRGFTSG